MRRSYGDLRPLLSTGDLVAFRGVVGVVSRSLGLLGPYTHVGVVLRDRMGVFLWESTTLSDLKDIDSGATRQGVQVVPLSERVRTYRGRILVRRILPGLLREQEEAIFALRRELSRRPYERSARDLLRAWLDWLPGRRAEDLRSVFCSELAAEAYQRCGLLPELPPSDRYEPSDFAPGGKVDRLMLQPFRLDDEIELEVGVESRAA